MQRSEMIPALVLLLLPAACLAATIPSTPCPVTDPRCACDFAHPFFTLRCSHIADSGDLDAVVDNATEAAVILELDSVSWDFFPMELLSNSSLHTLLISNSSFRTFGNPNATVFDVPNLHHLSLENVTFADPPKWSDFSGLSRLEAFFAHNATLPGSVGNDFGTSMSKALQAVTISKSNVASIGPEAFKEMRNLTLLRINHSSIRRFEPRALPKPSKLEQLRLDNNKIHSLPEDTFADLPHLKLVSLSNNTLSTLPREVFGALWREEVHLELRGNPLKCDCRLLWIVNSPTRPSEIVGKCAYPKRLFGKNLKDITAQDLDCL